MRDNGKSMVIASFAADSLALGAHWIYDTEWISRNLGRVDSFLNPLPNSYHPTKKKGEFTHYGDQTFVLLESISVKKGFDLADFSDRWLALFESYTGYIDQATRVTLSNYATGKTVENAGSLSSDLAGASRMAPLVFRDRHDPVKLVKDIRAQTSMTHTDPLTNDSAEFFAMVALMVLKGAPPVKALVEVTDERFANTAISRWVAAGLESKNGESVSVISKFGQSCHTNEAFSGVVHLIAKYENDLEKALVQAVMAGGDSAARGMMVGMVLGAHLGSEALPEKWVSDMARCKEIDALLD